MNHRELQLLIGYAEDIKYVSVDKALNFNYPTRFRVNMDEFKYAVAGVTAACKQDEQSSDVINIDMIVDVQEKQLTLMRNSKTARHVPIILNSPLPCTDCSPIRFKYNLEYVNWVCKHFRDAKVLIFRCEDRSRPILVEPVDRTGKAASNGCEDFIFFATSRKV